MSEDRLDPPVLQKLIYKHFYNGPVGGAALRLAKIINRHAQGLPIMAFEEVLQEFLVRRLGLNETTDPKLAAENKEALAAERATFWKALNGKGGGGIVFDLIAYARAKDLYECLTEKVQQFDQPATNALGMTVDETIAHLQGVIADRTADLAVESDPDRRANLEAVIADVQAALAKLQQDEGTRP
ncbi:hypothetical protein HOU02_gp250 [Caulobacter phage CcrBL9]|uniref:Uncharacterized protein n=1 Tax=Caulobacter phage CcrBL9 TaxID=2283270 RepID=A0A385EEM4_9CAUD|nr:hypothetical protein HOU02_gp250 [Caulobacter phage CcrBL9]AXQ69475.1 hypothetical protein CcrBL9_gp451 [Caulobacter phage CcrBL9]